MCLWVANEHCELDAKISFRNPYLTACQNLGVVYQCKDKLDLFRIILPRSLLSLAAAAWHFIPLCGCFHFLTLPSNIRTASLCQINKQEQSRICMWPRFLCLFQFPLIVYYLLRFRTKENISRYHENCPFPNHPKLPIYGGVVFSNMCLNSSLLFYFI